MLSLQEAESMGEDVLSRFRAMRELLESLIKFWREFETNARRVEEHLTLCEMDNSELKGETKALFKNCERLGDQICIHATGAQPTITARVTKIRQRMEKIRRVSSSNIIFEGKTFFGIFRGEGFKITSFFSKNFYLKMILIGVILHGESIAHIPEA